ncbi:MAG: SGNH/GDSL hydrolase family protein [Treponema sp.]|nr:SGNH/GDSL hydrolase family protein [Treponema sp.]
MITFSVMGDSISSFAGTVPEEYETCYPHEDADIKSYDDMWQTLFAKKTGRKLLCSDAYSGSRVSETGTRPVWSAFISDRRIARLKGDEVIIFGGTNDFGQRESGAVPLSVFKDAYKTLIRKLRDALPEAVLYFCVPLSRLDWEAEEKNNAGWTQVQLQDTIRTIVREAQRTDRAIHVFDLSEISVAGLLFDGLHPNKGGMEAIATYMAAHV